MDRPSHKTDKAPRSVWSYVALLGATALLLGTTVYVVRNINATLGMPAVSRYEFDEDTQGWVPRTRSGDQAVIDVQQQIKLGQSTLEVQSELIGQDEQKSKGEVFVDLSSNPPLSATAPLGATAPLDLRGKPITMSIYVPAEAIGNRNSPNGVQVFITDDAGRSQYSDWINLTSQNTETWTTVALLPLTEAATSATVTPRGASIDAGFDPSKINIVGLKIGAGEGFAETFRGSIWIDKVSWP